MIKQSPEYFGNADQQALERRAHDLWALVKGQTEYACHGRVVGLAHYTDDNLAQQIALARLQGVGPVDGMPRERLAERRSELENAGLATDVYDHWIGGEDSFKAAQDLLDLRLMPADLEVCAAGPDTSTADMSGLDDLTQSCDVLLPMGSFMRGLERPSSFLYARDRNGKVVGAAAGVAQFHDAHEKGNMIWWGMLSTDPDRRGEGIGLLLGAMVLRNMKQAFGYSACFTGIRHGNAPSEALCSKLALRRSDMVDLLAIFPEAFGGGQMTK